MWIYIITWCVINHIEVECDCNKPYKDDLGRTIQNSYSVYCEKIEYECNHKFKTHNRDSAFTFYLRAKSEVSIIPANGTVDSVKIDSVKYIK